MSRRDLKSRIDRMEKVRQGSTCVTIEYDARGMSFEEREALIEGLCADVPPGTPVFLAPTMIEDSAEWEAEAQRVLALIEAQRRESEP